MTTLSRRRKHSLLIASVALAGVLLPAVSAHAQTATVDTRWQAWHGCWQPMADPVTGVNSAPFSQVCVVPGDRATAVDLITIADGRMASRETLDVAGRHASDQDGCTGWEQAEWSADGRRLYRTSEHQCANGLKRTTAGLFGMTAGGDWLDVMSVTTADSTGVRVMHYRPSFMINNALPADAQTALQQRIMAMSTARTMASAPATMREITDVSTHMTSGVTQAWLTELGQKFDVSGRDLVALKGAGVPDKVTDLLVALAYPNTFGLKRGPSPTVTTAATATVAGGVGPRSLTDCRLSPGYYSNSCGLYSPFMYGYGPYGYNYYGVGPYSYRPYGTWYSGAEPVVIVVGGGGSDGSGTANGSAHGQVSKTRGYVEGQSNPAPTPTVSSATPSSAPAPSSSDGGGGGGGSSAPSSSSGGERTAHPR